jgi:hypothetical protein
VADGVHATVEPMQPPCLDPPRDRRVAEADRTKLRAADDP